MERKDKANLPFKKAGYYENLEEAMRGVPGDLEGKIRAGRARLQAQKTAKKIKEKLK